MAFHRATLDRTPEHVELFEYRRRSADLAIGTMISILYHPVVDGKIDWLRSYHHLTYPDGKELWTLSWCDPIRVEDMQRKYLFPTASGPFYIAELDNRWYGLICDEAYVSSDNPHGIARAFANGECGPDGLFSTLGIPADLSGWTRIDPF